MTRIAWTTSALIAVLGLQVVSGAELYVAPNGDDNNPGTQDKPLATVSTARDKARGIEGESITVLLAGGTYYLNEPIVLTPGDSGTAATPIVYAAMPSQEPILSGGQRLTLTWEPYKDGILQAEVPENFTTDQLFVNGRRLPMARYPNYDPSVLVFNGYDRDCFSKERAARWSDPRGGFIHAMHRNRWGDFHYLINGKDKDGKVTYEGGWQNNRPMGMHNEYRFVENILEELDAPGEWFLDESTNKLYVYPPNGVDLSKARIESVRLRHLIEFRGTQEQPVKFVGIRGITFRHAARVFMDNKEPLLRSDWTTYRGGAIFLSGCEDCSLQDCLIDQVGGNAVFVNHYNRRVRMSGCHIPRAGANAIAFVGDPEAVRSPLFQYNQRQPYDELDKTPGPRTNNYPAECLVEDCLIYLSGRVEKQTAGVQISMAQDITVRHCSIYDMPRAGINISEGTWGGHVIEFCDVFDTVKETGDHGSFNSWGRDRFWGLNDLDLNDDATFAKHRLLPRLDVVKPITIRNSRWRCDHGWDIDLDDGSSNYQLSNNLCLNGGIKLREGFYRVCENNIMVNNSFHPHVWYKHSQDVFRRNIVCSAYRPIRVPVPWGKEIDFNFWHERDAPVAPAEQLMQQSGRDQQSIVGDARFLDPATGDFRVAEDSPAKTLIGFENFPMDEFGVTSPRLRKIARTPAIPELGSGSRGKTRQPRSQRDPRVHIWEGANIKNVIGMGEQSSLGLGSDKAVVFVEVPGKSRAASLGLQQHDAVVALGKSPVTSVADLQKLYDRVAATETVSLQIVRNQVTHTLQIPGSDRITLSPRRAKMIGSGERPKFDERKNFLGSWSNQLIHLHWQLDKIPAGRYRVTAVIACDDRSAGATYDFTLGDEKISGKVAASGGWENFVEVQIGVVEVSASGPLKVVLKPTSKPGMAVMNLRAVVLHPTGRDR